MKAGSRLKILVEIFLLAGLTALALIAVRQHWIARLDRFDFWLTPAIFLYAPLLAVLVTDGDFSAIGLTWPQARKAGIDLIVFMALVLPVFLLGWWLVFSRGLGLDFRMRPLPDPAGLILWQLLGVALPEEIFFRGWLQGRLDRLWRTRWKIPGASAGPGLVVAALLFASAHYLVKPSPVRLLVFFPGLLFGYFRERSGSVMVPILAHAAGNVAFLALQSWAVG